MTKEHIENEEFVNDESFEAGDDTLDPEQDKCDNVAEEDAPNSDEMAEEVSLQEQIAVWRDKFLRLQAEFDNYRKRTLKEKMELVERGGEGVLKSLLPVVDDIERATEAMTKSDDIQALRNGVTLIAQKFQEVLKSHNVSEIEAEGQELDTDLHEAIAKFAAGDDKRGKIIDVTQKGYKLGDKVMRYAKVVVGE